MERFAPPLGPGLRHDVGVRAGDTVSRYYDTLLAKLIAYGPDRDAALARLAWALRRYVIQGLPTNQALLLAVAGDADFRAVRLRTDYFEHHPTCSAAGGSPGGALGRRGRRSRRRRAGAATAAPGAGAAWTPRAPGAARQPRWSYGTS